MSFSILVVYFSKFYAAYCFGPSCVYEFWFLLIATFIFHDLLLTDLDLYQKLLKGDVRCVVVC